MHPLLQVIAASHVALFVFALGGWFALRRQYDGYGIWLTWQPHENPWCEQDEAYNFAREPANTLSDFAFLAVALFVSFCGFQDKFFDNQPARNDITANPMLSFCFAVLNLLHFVGTTMNHSCRCQVGHVLDCTGMLSVISWFGLYGWWQQNNSKHPQVPLTAGYLVMASLALYVGLLNLERLFPSHRMRDAMTLLAVGFTAHAAYMRYSQAKAEWHLWLLKILCALALIAGIAWIFDVSGWFCYPESMIQGHAIFHYLTAIDILLGYLYIRSQRNPSVVQCGQSTDQYVSG